MRTELDMLVDQAFDMESLIGGIEHESVGDISPTDYIKWVQRSLNRVCGTNIPTDGKISTAYRAAVRKFNQKYLRRDYDDVDEHTQNAIISANKENASYVVWIIRGLNAAGLGPLSTSQRLTSSAVNAIKQFQARQYPEIKADGYVGSKTELALIRASGLLPPGAAFHPRLGRPLSIPASYIFDAAPPKKLQHLEETLQNGCVGGGSSVCRVKDRDRRKELTYTGGIPYRWICMFLVQFSGDDTLYTATGFRFADNRLLTAAHVLVDRQEVGDSAVLRGARRIIFIPGLNGMPSSLSPVDRWAVRYGIYEIKKVDDEGNNNFWVPQEYIDRMASSLPREREDATQFDYGVIDISKRKVLVSGKLPRGNWGATKRSKAIAIAAETMDSDEILRMLLRTRNEGTGINLSGYPGDKPCTQWKCANGRVIRFAKEKSAMHNELQHWADNAPGMSGAPVWLFERNQQSIKYTLVGINSACAPFGKDDDSGTSSEPKVLFNRACVITPEVLRRLQDLTLLARVP